MPPSVAIAMKAEEIQNPKAIAIDGILSQMFKASDALELLD